MNVISKSYSKFLLKLIIFLERDFHRISYILLIVSSAVNFFQFLESVCIWSFSGPYFPAFWLNTRNTDQKTPKMDAFHAMLSTKDDKWKSKDQICHKSHVVALFVSFSWLANNIKNLMETYETIFFGMINRITSNLIIFIWWYW